MPARAVIINADDLGLAASINAAIFAAWERRAIGDCSVLATIPKLTAILEQARKIKLPVGIHLNLTYGHPLSHPSEIPDFVAADGVFVKRQRWPSPVSAEQARLEFTRQIQRVLDQGFSPSHLDSHHHVHTYPELLPMVIELAKCYQLPLRALTPAMHTQLHEEGILSPACFSKAFYGADATLPTLINAVAACPGGVLEIMTHPGYADPLLPSSYREGREQEFAILTSESWREYLIANRIPIIGFAGL